MVLTRSRNASPSAAGASVKAEAQLQLPAPDMSCPRGDDTSAAEAVVVVPQPAAGAAELRAEIEGAVGTFLVDTGAKHCIGSVSLRSYLASKDHVFHKVFTELKYADGRICKLNVEVTNVKVTVRGVTLLVSFIMLPNATESLLGMNFIRDVGMVLDFDRGVWAVRGDRSPQRITFESTPIQSVTCSSVGLREDEAQLEDPEIKKILDDFGDGDTAVRWTDPFLTFAREMRSPVGVHTDIRAIVSRQNFVPQFTPYLKEFARVLHDVKLRVEEQQEVRKGAADRRRRDVTPFRDGDLVLVEAHSASNAAKGFSQKFAPRREGPYRVSQVVSPTTYVVVDNEGRVKGKYHASALTPYSGESPTVVHPRRRGRPAKSQPGRSCDLEGEPIARNSNTNESAHTPSLTRRSARVRARAATAPNRQ
ncbi:hypothetical protein SFRURICE_008027 [Spodoptera frugiperda]|nr:hypothetical protein SFRURICE_008027 [Spodoptera frugiperda]